MFNHPEDMKSLMSSMINVHYLKFLVRLQNLERGQNIMDLQEQSRSRSSLFLLLHPATGSELRSTFSFFNLHQEGNGGPVRA